ncbi:hypothetical protein SH139x_000231 [Planctomycetaceae bacterium SH139]
MEDSTPEIERILDEITTICRDSLLANSEFDQARIDQLTKALVINGWKRHQAYSTPLAVQVKQRVIDSLENQSLHHKAQLESLAKEVQNAYDSASKYETTMPESERPVNKRKELSARPPNTNP